MANFLSIDLAAIESVLTNLLALKGDLDVQMANITNLDGALDTAVQGDAIVRFKNHFDKWSGNLGTISDEIDQAYSALRTLATAAETGASALNAIV